MLKLQAVDDSNRSAHYYLTPDDECYFIHEFTARKGYAYSAGNQFIFNFKKSPTKRNEAQYRYKLEAIETAIGWYRSIFEGSDDVYTDCTLAPIPPSKVPGHPEYDDRMWQVVKGICKGKDADGRELIRQSGNYDAAHLTGDGGHRIKPHELRELYELDAQPPKDTVLLFDDVLSAGTHFTAAKSVIMAKHPHVRVIGLFLARRVLSDPIDEFQVIEE